MVEATRGKNIFRQFVYSNYDVGHFAMVLSMGVAIGLAFGLRVWQEVVGTTNNQTQTFKSSYGVYQHAAVASDSKICSDIGRDIMSLNGGNAIDAAAATVLCSGAIYPHSTGIGGGGHILIYLKKHGFHAIDARETVPMAASRDMFGVPGKNPSLGPLSICVPGLLKGLLEMHKRFGSLPWKTVVGPTIQLLQNGFPLQPQTYTALVRLISPRVEKMKGYEMFLDANNRIKPTGSMIQMPKLVRTLQILAEDPMSFYEGSVAQNVVKDIQEKGGIFQQEDLNSYKVLVRKPTQLDMPGDLTLYTVPLTGGGASLNYILSILSGYNMTADDMATDEAKVLTYHRFVEAVKFSQARKTALGDGNFVDVKYLVKNMSSRYYGETTRLLINDSRTYDVDYYEPSFYSVQEHGTSHSSILDKEGNAVSISSSINMYFGSQIIGNRTGIIFNNQMNDFSHPHLAKFYNLQPAEANFIQPGKRPLSAMCPTIVWDHQRHRVSVVTGAAGGAKIPAGLAQTLMNALWFNMSLQQSIDLPRVYHELLPMNVQAESSFPRTLRARLMEKGHSFLDPIGITVVQMIQVLENSIMAVSDFRKGGEPSGF